MAMRFTVGTRVRLLKDAAYDGQGTGWPATWARSNGCVIVPAGAEGVILRDDVRRGERSVRWDGMGSHRSCSVGFAQIVEAASAPPAPVVAALPARTVLQQNRYKTGVEMQIQLPRPADGNDMTLAWIDDAVPMWMGAATVEDLRALAAWTEEIDENMWLRVDGKRLTLTGIVYARLACEVADISYPDMTSDDAVIDRFIAKAVTRAVALYSI